MLEILLRNYVCSYYLKRKPFVSNFTNVVACSNSKNARKRVHLLIFFVCLMSSHDSNGTFPCWWSTGLFIIKYSSNLRVFLQFIYPQTIVFTYAFYENLGTSSRSFRYIPNESIFTMYWFYFFHSLTLVEKKKLVLNLCSWVLPFGDSWIFRSFKMMWKWISYSSW